ncbi:MAG: hypothetical protein JO331_16080 [Verrucomicrobia bacterium]|nr:hypothetical protein [Verrucomicrobiota bacterium]
MWEISYAEAVAERREERWWSAELHRLRGVFLTAMSAYEVEIEASFCEALRIAKERDSSALRAPGSFPSGKGHRKAAQCFAKSLMNK